MARRTPEEEFQRIAGRLGDKAPRVVEAVRRAFRKDGFRWKGAVKRRVQGKPNLDGPSKRSTLASRRGNAGLAGGFYAIVSGNTLENLQLQKGNTQVHAVTHEFGATITPKRAKYLTIPLRDAMTPGGVPRRAGARDWPNTFVYQAPSGQLFIAQGADEFDGDTDALILLYMLKRKVTIPARLGMRKVNEDQAPQRLKDLQAEVGKALLDDR